MWWVLDGVWGSNVGSQVNGTHTSYVCSAACPTGISSANFGFNNGLGYQWSSLGDLASVNGTGYETVDTSHAWRLAWHQSVADMGNHSWYQSVAIAQNKQDYVSGASSSQEKIGYTIRYFYNRTYGFEVYFNKALHFDYTDPAGVEYSAYAPANWGVSGIWVPAMNINVTLNYTPSKTPVLNAADFKSGGYSWSLTLDYGF
jgi:hypothetical protein